MSGKLALNDYAPGDAPIQQVVPDHHQMTVFDHTFNHSWETSFVLVLLACSTAS